VLAWDPHGSGDGTRQRAGNGSYVGRVGLEPTTGGLWEVRLRAACAL